MFVPEVDPADIAGIKRIVEDFFVLNPRNADGSPRQQTVFTPQESDALVNRILGELGRRGYAVMKPKPEDA